MTAPVRPERPSTEDGGGGLSTKIGPLPTWAWLAITAAGGVVVLLWLQSRKNAASSTTDTSGTVSPSTADVANLQDQLATVGSQIRDLQGGQSQPNTGASPYQNLPNGPYLFGLINDPNLPNAGGIYVGIPGFGWAWAPNPTALQPYIDAHHPQQLANLTQDQANATFGPLKGWQEISSQPVGIGANYHGV